MIDFYSFSLSLPTRFGASTCPHGSTHTQYIVIQISHCLLYQKRCKFLRFFFTRCYKRARLNVEQASVVYNNRSCVQVSLFEKRPLMNVSFFSSRYQSVLSLYNVVINLLRIYKCIHHSQLTQLPHSLSTRRHFDMSRHTRRHTRLS